MAIDFDAETSRLFTGCDDLIGDALTITPSGGSATSIRGQVNYGQAIADFGDTGAVIDDMSVDYDAALIAGKPGKGWRVALPRLAGRLFEPLAVRRDESGKRWVFGLKEVFDA